jgi:hypothetical protein
MNLLIIFNAILIVTRLCFPCLLGFYLRTMQTFGAVNAFRVIVYE